MSQQSDSARSPAADPGGFDARTQPDALRQLDDKALAALLRDMRAAKNGADDTAVQKSLAKAIRRAVAEKRGRQPAADAAAAKPAAAKAAKPAKDAKPAKAEDKALKQAERAERKRVKDAERAERKAAKDAEKLQRKAARPAGKKDKPAKAAKEPAKAAKEKAD